MADDSYVKEKQVRDLTTTMIGVVNDLPQTSEDMGSATAAQGEKADSAVQPATMAAAFNTRIITGKGRPDIPATLTEPGVADLVASAPDGTQFVSLDGPQGAWEWRKRGSAWVVKDGDTGEIDISGLLINGWEVYAPAGLRIKRTAESVFLVGGVNLTNATNQEGFLVPEGFRPKDGNVYHSPGVGWVSKSVVPFALSYRYFKSNSRDAQAVIDNRWHPNGPWPTTLPGPTA